MEITVTQEQARVPVTILAVKGRVNLGNAEELEARANQVYGQGARQVLLDLAEVESLTSAGLRAILFIHKLLAQPESGSEPGSLKLSGATREVQRVLHIAGFDVYLDLYPDRRTALDSF